jgi:hypothetical protein
MKDTFILNLVHRPELNPEYAEKTAGGGKGLEDESIDIFKLQQRLAHENGLKTTIQMTYSSLFSQYVVDLAKSDHQKYGDEIGLSLLGLPCRQFNEKYRTKDFCIWMFSLEDRKRIIDDVFGKFFECFGFWPESTGSYYLDAQSIAYIEERYPSVKCAVATCWEEGPKAYHTCNNSWYTLMDGGPWNPWIPSTCNTHVPAKGPEDDSHIVAIPHLSRDLIACFDGNGSNFGTHPQNVLRGMVYEGDQYPYLFNLIDQYRHMGKYNGGYSYNMMFVGPGWLNKKGRWEAPYSLLEKSYSDAMAYYGNLKKEGKLCDMGMSEFASWFRENRLYSSEAFLWKDILYGSEKSHFWYSSPSMRCCLDMNQGGAMIDLRPYESKLVRECGIGTSHVQDVSYPFLIQANYRAGYFTHYAGEGTVKSCTVSYGGVKADMCLCRTKALLRSEDGQRVLELDPVQFKLGELVADIQSVFYFKEGSNEVKTVRKVLRTSIPDAKVCITEYMTACYGTTEYPEPMDGIKLIAGDNTLDYQYKCRTVRAVGCCTAVVPQVECKVSMHASEGDECFVKEGYAFSPMFTLGLVRNAGQGEVFESWLKLEKAN